MELAISHNFVKKLGEMIDQLKNVTPTGVAEEDEQTRLFINHVLGAEHPESLKLEMFWQSLDPDANMQVLSKDQHMILARLIVQLKDDPKINKKACALELLRKLEEALGDRFAADAELPFRYNPRSPDLPVFVRKPAPVVRPAFNMDKAKLVTAMVVAGSILLAIGVVAALVLLGPLTPAATVIGSSIVSALGFFPWLPSFGGWLATMLTGTSVLATGAALVSGLVSGLIARFVTRHLKNEQEKHAGYTPLPSSAAGASSPSGVATPAGIYAGLGVSPSVSTSATSSSHTTPSPSAEGAPDKGSSAPVDDKAPAAAAASGLAPSP